MATHSDSSVLPSVRAVVLALGGTKATADVAGVKSPAVSNWLSFDCIPPKHFLAIADALGQRGMTPARAIFRENRTPLTPSENHVTADV